MKEIGIEMTCAMSARRGGIGTYAVELSKALSTLPGYNKEYHLNFLYKLSRLKKANLRYIQTGASNYWHGAGLPVKKFDLIHCTDTVFYKSENKPLIITIHDLAIFKPFLYAIPGYTTTEFREKMFERVSQMIKNCDGIICVSKRTQSDLFELFPDHGKPVAVTYLGIKSDLNKAPLKVRDLPLTQRSYILFTGLVSIRKNVLGLLRGFKEAGLQKQFDLVLAGEKGMGWDIIEREIRELGLADVIKITGYLDDNSLTYYYRHATAVAMCTYYEGFGLPALEAMSMGIPVLIGKYGSLPEVCGGFAALCDPFEVESLATGLEAVLNLPPSQVALGAAHAQSFTWKRCTEQTLEFYSKYF